MVVSTVAFEDEAEDIVTVEKKTERRGKPECLKLCKRWPHSQTTVEDTTASTFAPAPKEEKNDDRGKDPWAVELHATEARRAPKRSAKRECLKLSKRGPHSQTTVDDTTASTLPPAPKVSENDMLGKDPRAVERHAKRARRRALHSDFTKRGQANTLQPNKESRRNDDVRQSPRLSTEHTGRKLNRRLRNTTQKKGGGALQRRYVLCSIDKSSS
jgi:hypothetical protein